MSRSLMVQKDTRPNSQSKYLSDSDSDDNKMDPRFKTSIEERQYNTMISDIIVKHLWDKGQMWPLFATTAAYAMNTFASEVVFHLSN